MHRISALVVASLASGAARAATSSQCPKEMVLVPGGSYKPEQLEARATVAPFCLDRTEVTVEAFTACVQRGDCSRPDDGYGCTWGKDASLPINCLDFNQATIFCAASGKRLPLEEEWEWAARGGARAARYPWGNEGPGAQVCSGRRSDAGPCPVGSFPAGDNPQGVHDLAGNVAEWTASTFAVRSQSDRVFRVVRGGDYFTLLVSSGMGYRDFSAPSQQESRIGFRCARDLAPAAPQPTLCGRDEKIVLSCAVGGGKILSVCASRDLGEGRGSLQYRFGKPGKPELTYPRTGVDPHEAFKYGEFSEWLAERAGPSASRTGTYLRFETPGAAYTVYSNKGTEGVRVSPAGKKPIDLPCRGTVLDDFRSLESAGFPAPNDEPLGERPQ